jgi:hypothetical protein
MPSKRHGAACGSVRLGCWQIAGNSGPGDQRPTRGRPPGKAVLAASSCCARLKAMPRSRFASWPACAGTSAMGAVVARARRTPVCPVSGCSGGVRRLPACGPAAGGILPSPADWLRPAAHGDPAAPSCSSRPRWAHLARSWRSASNASCRSRWAISLRCHHRVSRTWPGGTSRRAIISSWGCQGSRSTRAHQRLW